jgi:hypothetical protein
MDWRGAFAVPGRGNGARAEIWTQIDSTLAVRKPRHRDGVTGFDAHRYNIQTLCIHIDVAHRKKPDRIGVRPGQKNTVSWHEDGARQVYDATHDYEILLVNKWCNFAIDSQREIFAQRGIIAISGQFSFNVVQPARCGFLLSGSGNTRT